jgi:hypothetical protein
VKQRLKSRGKSFITLVGGYARHIADSEREHLTPSMVFRHP